MISLTWEGASFKICSISFGFNSGSFYKQFVSGCKIATLGATFDIVIPFLT
jgi:hypothetical protein